MSLRPDAGDGAPAPPPEATSSSRNTLTLVLHLAASAFSLFGNAAINIVLPWLVLERTGDPALAGTVAAVSAVPSAVAAFIGGHLIDRFGRRTITVIADVGSAASVAGLAIVDHLTGLDLTWFIVLGVTGALFDLPGMTARETMIADISRTSGRSLDLIAGWRQTIFGLSFLLGPAIAGFLLSILPTIDVVWVTAACSGLAALLTAIMRLHPAPAEPQAENPLGALATIRRSKPLTWIIGISVVSSMLVAPLLAVVLPAHFQQMGRADWLGLALSAYAVGTIIGGGLYAAWLKRHRLPSWIMAMALFSAAFVLIAFLDGFWIVALGMAVAGIGQGLSGPLMTVLMTEQIPERLRGRVFGVMVSTNAISSPVGLAVMSTIIAATDLQMAAWALAITWAPMGIAACFAPSLRAWLTSPPVEPPGKDLDATASDRIEPTC